MEIFLLVGAVLIIIIVIAILTSAGGSKSQPEWKRVLKNNIYKAEERSNSNNYSEVKDSLVELDKLLDYLLKNKRVTGDTLGERLKNSRNMFNQNDYNALWNAHKLRNQLVHEVDHNVNIAYIKSNAKTVAAILKKFN